MRIPNLVALLALGFATISPPSHAATAVAEHLRDTRYGEVLTVRQHGLDLSVKVYSTMGLNDCPEALWKDLNADRLAKQYRVKFVKLNGPRHWTLDRLEAWGGSRTGETETFGGIKMALRATIHASLLQGGLGSKKYAETIVKRDTVFTFDAGKPVYELVDPTGKTYVMQSYAQIVEPGLTMKDLPGLGHRLHLPAGWHYVVKTPTEDLQVRSTGTAHVVNDDLLNTYLRI